MFGYLKPYVPLLRVKDHELYRAVYCGVCRSLENCFGKTSSLTLSYDVAFLAAVRIAMSREKITVRKKRCSFNPFRKCRIAEGGEELDFCASVGILLTYYKILDTIDDEHGIKKFAALATYPAASLKRKTVIKKYGSETDDIIRCGISRLSEIEKADTKSIDAPASAFADMLGKITSFGYEGNNRIIAGRIGECVGRWIYIADAIDDCREDIERQRYNPIAALYGREPTEAEYEMLKSTLGPVYERLAVAVDMIDFAEEDMKEEADKSGRGITAYFSEEIKAILVNTVDYGMPHAMNHLQSNDKNRSL